MDELQILGKRTITSADGDQITITVFLPIQEQDGDCRCEFSLVGLSMTGKKRRTYGIDGIQAVYLALQSIGSDLEEIQKATGKELRWEGGKNMSDLGFPKIVFPL